MDNIGISCRFRENKFVFTKSMNLSLFFYRKEEKDFVVIRFRVNYNNRSECFNIVIS